MCAFAADSTYHLFKNRIEVIRGVVVGAIHYHPHDFIVIENANEGMPSLKCKIINFFSHALDGHHQLFFKGYFFAQIEGAWDDFTCMDIVGDEALGTCILPIHKIRHKFFPHPTVVQGPSDRAIVVFELQDISVPNHLLVPGKPGCCTPWPVVEDIVIISLPSPTSDSTLYLAYVLEVDYGNDNRNKGDNVLEVGWVISDYDTIGNQVFRVKDMNLVYTLTWNSVWIVVDNSLFQRAEFCEPSTPEWRAPAN